MNYALYVMYICAQVILGFVPHAEKKQKKIRAVGGRMGELEEEENWGQGVNSFIESFRYPSLLANMAAAKRQLYGHMKRGEEECVPPT